MYLKYIYCQDSVKKLVYCIIELTFNKCFNNYKESYRKEIY